MARSQMRHNVKDTAGNVIQNALCYVYLTGTTTAVTDMYAASTGGAAITTLTSDAQGDIEAWFTTAKVVDIKVTDNSNAAYYPSVPARHLDWTDFTETLSIPAPPGADLEPLPLRNVTVTATDEIAVTIDVVDGVLYGRGRTTNPQTLYRSTDDGATWSLVHDFAGAGGVTAVRKMSNGEVIVCTNALYRSTGWAASPSGATWTLAASPTATAGGHPAAAIIVMNLAVYGKYVLAGEYVAPDRTQSKKLRLSTDYGVTFTDTLNLDTLYPGDEVNTHWHGAAIDPWAATASGVRLWASHGDGPRAILYSDDEGATWATFRNDRQPTVIAATEYGVVFSTDANDPDGVYRALRTTVPTDMVYEQIHRIREGFRSGSLYGFATHAFYDPTSGLVYIAFNSNIAGVPSFIFATDGRMAAEVYRTSTTTFAGLTSTENVVVTAGRKVFLHFVDALTSTRYTVKGDAVVRGVRSVADLNAGGILTGAAATRGAIGAGYGVNALERSVVIGNEAVSTGTVAVVIGESASATGGDSSVVVGQAASTTANTSVVIGAGATSTGVEGTAVGRLAAAAATSTVVGKSAAATTGSGVAIGHGATANASQATAVGKTAVASQTNNVALGIQATASGNSAAIAIGAVATASSNEAIAIGKSAVAQTNSWAVAIGSSANASHQNSVALGHSSTTTTTDQIAIAARHIELTEVASDAAAPAANGARWYVKDNGSGKTQLCVRFNTGAVQVIATEP